ncbi:MAG TPA: VOC family protein, partial [Symbiobacteriaceae bacterium]|nr:VOC family protein [Symbiobacteriaceae bacterium]
VMGGEHPNWGTHNSLCHLGLPYIELIAVQDPVQAAKSEFGRSVLARATAGGGLVTSALTTDDLDTAVARLRQNGVAVEGPFEGRRQRPDGSLLQWRMAWPEPYGDLPMPFLIQWQQSDAEREADLKARGVIAPDAPALDVVVYAVRNQQDAAAAFRRYYGVEAGEVGIMLTERPESQQGPREVRLQGARRLTL